MTFTFIVHETVEEAVVRKDGEQGNKCKALELGKEANEYNELGCFYKSNMGYKPPEFSSSVNGGKFSC